MVVERDQADLVLANLECTISTRGTKWPKTFTFRAPVAAANSLAAAGIDAVSNANNHAIDYGLDGLADTLKALDAAGIAHAGAGMTFEAARSLAISEVRGVKVGLLSYSLTFPTEFYATKTHGGTAHGEQTWVVADIQKARPLVDVLLVAFHWSAELLETPKPYQLELGHAAIDAGADGVLGTHPHILQGIELYRGKPILYSLGNYAFGSRSHKAADSALVRLRFQGRTLAGLSVFPLDVDNTHLDFDPQVATGARAARIGGHLAELSSKLGTKLQASGDRWDLSTASGAAPVSQGEAP